MKKINLTHLKQITRLYKLYSSRDICNSFARPVYYDGQLWIVNGISAIVLEKDYLPKNNEFLFNVAEALPTYDRIEAVINYLKDMFKTAQNSNDYFTFKLDKDTLRKAIKEVKTNQGVKHPVVDLGGVYVKAEYLLSHIGISRRKSAFISIGNKKDPVIISGDDGAISLLMPFNINEDTINRDEIITLQSVNAYV